MRGISSPEYARTIGARLRLEGSNCSGCGIRHFPGRIICPDCGSDAMTFNQETEIKPRQVVEVAEIKTEVNK